ncbi:hypothetical protein LPJ76_003651 [Coemansia sp. RSA 638]|nr:hypothetical protein LPJ76_003651 [Coemansia sp. RSA 638]
MVLSTYEAGTICWAKLKGYPWWPSRIEVESELTEEVLDSKPRNGRVYPVLFFGSLDYAWITPENLELYEENLAKHGSKAKNRKDPSFADALKQAQDPALAEEVIRRNSAAQSTSEEDEDDEGGEQEESSIDEDDDVDMKPAESASDHKPSQPKAGGRGTRANNGRSKQASVGRKRMSLSSNSSGDDVAPEASPKRSRTTAKEELTPTSGSPENSRRDSEDGQSAAKESPRSASPSARQSPEQSDHKSTTKDDAKSGRGSKVHQHTKNPSKTYQFLMQLRHKLQKTVIKGPTPEDLAPVSEVLRKLEDFEMTLELIQETKLGKVMRIIASSERLQDAPEEKYDIKGRAARLAEKWRQLVVRLRDGSAEPTALESPTRKSPESDSRRDDPNIIVVDFGRKATANGNSEQPKDAPAAIAPSDAPAVAASAAVLDTPAENSTNAAASEST